jgi:hypothetical protein
MTLDGLQFLFMGMCFPVSIYVFTTSFPTTYRTKWIMAGLLVVWFIFTAAFTVPGIGPVPGALFGIVLPVFVVSLVMLFNTQANAAVLQATVPLLVALHITRIAGGLFIPLFWEGRLSNPFAFIAGGGDLLSAFLAVPACIIALRARPGWEKWVMAWNLVGFIDFMSAITLGFTSQPGSPFQLFTDLPGTQVLGELPWRFIPSFFVPLFIMVHIALFIRLWRPVMGDAK